MKVLYVSSGDDYAALSFEEKEFDHKEIWEKARKCDNYLWIYEDEECCLEIQALEFGEVDSEFIEFVRNDVQDYDACKHADFYIVEE